MRFFIIIILLFASTANAELLRQSGRWRADSGSVAAGQTACLLSTQEDDRLFALKMLDDTANIIYIQLNKRSWDIPEKMEVEITLLFTPDSARGFNAKDLPDPKMTLAGIGFAPKSERFGSDVILPIPNLTEFMDTFLRSAKMAVLFSKGGEAPWIFDTTGSIVNVTMAFIDCARKHRDKSLPPTQPHR